MLTLMLALASIQDPLPVLEGLEYGPETTVITEPRRPDGTIDYVKALNDRYGEGVTPENNAAVEVLLTMDASVLVGASGSWHNSVLEQLGIGPLDEQKTFVKWDDFPELGDSPKERIARDKVASSLWTEERYPAVAQWLEANRDAMEIVAMGSRKDRFFVPLTGDPDESDPMLLNSLLMHTGQVRELAGAFAARAHARIGDGHIELAWSDAMVVRRLARLVDQEPMIVSVLVAQRIDNVSSAIIRNIASSEELDALDARNFLQDVLSPLDMESLHDSVTFGERFVALDTLQYIHKRPSSLASLTGSLDDPADETVQRMSEHYDVNIAMRATNTVLDHFLDATELRAFSVVAGQLELASDTFREYARAGSGEFARLLNVDEKPVSRTNVAKGIVAMFLPAIGNVVRDRWEIVTHEDLDLIALALGGYHAAHGKFPEQLINLVPEFLNDIPLDRFNEQALSYRIDGNVAIVWSVGPDQQDDGGDLDNDVVATVRRKPPDD